MKILALSVFALTAPVQALASSQLCAYVHNQTGGSVTVSSSVLSSSLSLVNGQKSTLLRESGEFALNLSGQVAGQVTVYWGMPQITGGSLNMYSSNSPVDGTDCAVIYTINIYS